MRPARLEIWVCRLCVKERPCVLLQVLAEGTGHHRPRYCPHGVSAPEWKMYDETLDHFDFLSEITTICPSCGSEFSPFHDLKHRDERIKERGLWARIRRPLN